MGVYFGIGFFVAGVAFCVWIFIFGLIVFEFISAYIHARVPVKPRLIKSIFPKAVSLYSYTERKYKGAGIKFEDAMDGDFATFIGFIGFFVSLFSIFVWPATIAWVVIKGLHEYYNNPTFQSLFANRIEEEKPLKGLE